MDANGINKVAKATATKQLADARADLANLPPGSTIVIEYARDPGPGNREAMAAILLKEPRIARVSFAGKPITR